MLFLAVLIICIAWYLLAPHNLTSPKLVLLYPTTSPTVPPAKNNNKILFVPSWTITGKDDFSGFQELVYFGITPQKDQSVTLDKNSLEKFIEESAATPKLLGIVMTDTSVNQDILSSKSAGNIANKISITAKANGFKGVVLDFELSALGFDSVTRSVTSLEKTFADNAHANNLLFYSAIDGDDFLRARPYDVSQIGKFSDGVFILAYDYHKANGDPGANFPLVDNADGYDFKTMVSDFSKNIPSSKIIVTFGLYGYDWKLDSQGRSFGQATALSYLKIKQDFIDSCSQKNCRLIRDKDSSETKITYVDLNNNQHVIWFEDPKSVATKTKYLNSMGIGSTAFWAYSYF